MELSFTLKIGKRGMIELSAIIGVILRYFHIM